LDVHNRQLLILPAGTEELALDRETISPRDSKQNVTSYTSSNDLTEAELIDRPSKALQLKGRALPAETKVQSGKSPSRRPPPNLAETVDHLESR